MEYQPYTYLIGWRKLNRWYYGVEYKKLKRKVAHPSNLWATYFTSSKEVQNYRITYGEPDVIKISKKKFKTAYEARAHENQFLKRVNAASKAEWINKTNGDVHGFSNKGRVLTDAHRSKISNMLKNKRHSNESYVKQSESLKRYFSDKPGTFTGRSHTLDSRKKNSTAKNPQVYNFVHKDYGAFTGSIFDIKTEFPEQKLWGRCLLAVSRGEYTQHKGWTVK